MVRAQRRARRRDRDRDRPGSHGRSLGVARGRRSPGREARRQRDRAAAGAHRRGRRARLARSRRRASRRRAGTNGCRTRSSARTSAVGARSGRDAGRSGRRRAGGHGATEATLPAVAAAPQRSRPRRRRRARRRRRSRRWARTPARLRRGDGRAPGSPYRWGMTIDLDQCTGCSACVVACYVENNIPLVGEEEVRRGRHMAWLRIERYVGDGSLEGGEDRSPDHPRRARRDRRRPPLCRCSASSAARRRASRSAPCIATYHNDDGLNGMIYNRCIGTRYCANNCPYKVRSFNWFDFALDALARADAPDGSTRTSPCAARA